MLALDMVTNIVAIVRPTATHRMILSFLGIPYFLY